MPGIGGLDTAYDVNETTSTSNITSSLTQLALNLGSALSAVGISKLATSAGATAIPTGNPTNPVVVVPAGSAAIQQQLAVAGGVTTLSKMLPLLLFGGLVIGAIIAFRR
jgi:hypothetical protein